MVPTADRLILRLNALENPGHAAKAQRFFKTGPGEYAEGDVFLGIRAPVLRTLSREFKQMPLPDLKKLLASPIHEARFCALVIMVLQFKPAKETGRTALYQLYLQQTNRINNWDLVDMSAGSILGAYLEDKDRSPLDRLAQSDDLWERRMGIIATQYFIRRNDFFDALRISEQLVDDSHDLIHKAVGWMLREVGNRDLAAEEQFLKRHYLTMPRTMLRYAIEKFPPERRKAYLHGTAF